MHNVPPEVDFESSRSAILAQASQVVFLCVQFVDRCVCDVQSVGSPYPERIWCLDYFEGDLCWAGVDDDLWVQFAGQLGDESLQNISLLASLQPADVKQACAAASATPIEGRAALKVKVSSTLDQSSDLEVEKASSEDLRVLRARFRSLEGEDPMQSEEVTDDQLSVISALVKAGVAPFADFGVWRPFSQRTAKNLKFTSHFFDNSGSWRCKEIPGPDSFSTWEACWRVFRTAAIMCDIAAPAVLDRYAARFRERVDRFSDVWHLCVLADTRCRSEFWEAEHRRQAHFHDSHPDLSAFVPVRPWNSVIRASANDRDFWKDELEDQAADFRASRRFLDRSIGKGRQDRSRSARRNQSKRERGREGGDHPQRSADGRHRTTATGTQICFAYNHSSNGCEAECVTRRAHVCEFCLEPHRSIECPQNPGWRPPVKGAKDTKGAGKGKHKGKK